MIKHINITNADIVKSMSDETKHNFANHCIINKIFHCSSFFMIIRNMLNWFYRTRCNSTYILEENE